MGRVKAYWFTTKELGPLDLLTKGQSAVAGSNLDGLGTGKPRYPRMPRWPISWPLED